MKRFIAFASALSTWMAGAGGIILVSVMLVTVLDVTSRCFGRPISGTYDVVALGGALVIGFSIPYTTMKKGHIMVDVLTQRLGPTSRNILNVVTRLMALAICLAIGWHLMKVGLDFYHKHEGSQTLQLSYYPIAYGLAGGFFVQCLANIAEIFTLVLGEKNE
jgi:TRAP-type C4-dicarboxylate transport system permease small subunit